MNSAARNFARRNLPASIRKPLGSLFGKLQEYVWLPFLGLVFDLSGDRFKTDGCTFIIPRKTTSLNFRAGFMTNLYEIDERRLVQKFIRPDDSVLEMGACLGIVSCITNKLLRDPSRHIAVEANPNCLPTLHRNRSLNQCNFLIENCAVSNQREVTFYLHPIYIVCGTAQQKSKQAVRVPGRSLQELNDRYGPFSVLIMDIEGGELESLEACSETLHHFRLIVIELHDWVIGTEGVNCCRKILQDAGFNMIERSFVTEAWVRS
jgi:FkbM family methyltransferase